MKLIRWSLLVLCAAAAAQAQQEIKVGGIFDLTGITSDVGKPYAQGVRDGVAWTNENGGINGKKIRLVDVDYGYKIPEAVAAYCESHELSGLSRREALKHTAAARAPKAG